MPYVLPALNVTCQQKVKTESYQDSKIQIQTCRWNIVYFWSIYTYKFTATTFSVSAPSIKAAFQKNHLMQLQITTSVTVLQSTQLVSHFK